MQKEHNGHTCETGMALYVLAAQLQQARIDQGMTQKQLAALMHVSRQTISNWENARSQPDYATLQKLAATLNLSLVVGRESTQN